MKRKTDEEIRARIAEHQQSVDEEEESGHTGGEDWLLAGMRKDELSWVLGE